MMRTFPLYDPKIYSFTLLKEERSGDIEAAVKKCCVARSDVKLDLSHKEGWTIIELMMEVDPGKKGTSQISADLIKIRSDELKRLRKTITDTIKPMLKTSKPHNYTLLTSGSHDNIWLRTYSDMSFLYKEKDEMSEILQTNVVHLNRTFRRTGDVKVNSLKHSKLEAMIYVLGHESGKKAPVFPEDLILEIDLSDISKSSSYGEAPIVVTPSSPYSDDRTEDKRSYQMRQNYLISLMALKAKMIDIFVLQSEFLNLKINKIKDVDKKGRDLKDQIFKLQNSINEHMKFYIQKPDDKKRSKEKDFLEKETYEMEKRLLTEASVRFSMLSEVEHEIMRLSSTLGDLTLTARDAIRSLDLRASDVAMEGISYSWGEMSIREIEQDTRQLNTLMEELSHSRDILSSNIEVLRTFIDTRQREVSEDMSRLMNLLFLVFACIGLADALGNFVILVLEKGYLSGDPGVSTVISYGAMGMLLTLLPLLLAAIFLYLYFKKK